MIVRLLIAVAMLVVAEAHADLSLTASEAAQPGMVRAVMSSRSSVDFAACDTLRLDPLGLARIAHLRITRGAEVLHEDSSATVTGAQWAIPRPVLTPATYQVVVWSSNNWGAGCPYVETLVVEPVEPEYSIVFGWTTVGAVYSNTEQRVIGAAEMLRLLNARDSTKARP